MSLTPASGTYLVHFSTSASISGANKNANFAIFNDGAITTDAEREYSTEGGHTTNVIVPVHVHSIETANGSQAIEVRYKTSGATLSVHERSLILLKVS